MKKWIKALLFFVMPFIGIIVVIAFFTAPYFAKKYVNQHGADYTGRKISVGQIKINYLDATFRVIDFKMFEPDSTSSFVTFDTLLVDLNLLPLLSSQLQIDRIHLIHPQVTIVRRDTLFNFDDIISFINSQPQSDTPEQKEKPMNYVLKDIVVKNGNLTFNDMGVGHVTKMKNLGFAIPYISYNENEASKAGIRFDLDGGGAFVAQAGYNRRSGKYFADFNVERLDISPFLPYSKAYFNLGAIHGTLDGDFHVDGNISKPDSIRLTVNGSVNDFVAFDLSDKKLIGAKTARVVMDDSYPVKFAFNFKTILLQEPYLFFEMKDSTNNFINLMVADTTTSDEPFNYFYRINQFVIEGGQLDFRDNTIGEPFNYHLSDISMKVDAFSSNDKWVSTYSSMRLNEHGKLKAELGINPSDPYELKMKYVLTNFNLRDLSLYSRHYVGFPIILGNMYYQGNTTISARQLNSENKLIIRNAKLGKKSGGLMNLPLKLALYLLKDIHGDVILDLPLSGDLNDPKTRVGRLVWQTLKNVVIKVVASPFLALSHLMGVEPAEVKGIEFNYADTTLSDGQLRRIRIFTELEQKKPDMKIEVMHYNDPQLEKRAIALEEAGKRFLKTTGEDYKKEKAQFAAYLASTVTADSLDVESQCMQLVGSYAVDSLQQLYSQKRISKIDAALYQFSDSTRLKVIIANKEAPENVGSRPVFELKFSIDE